jgi:GntR family transcriptional repressor for pyruvate dehydrogenase complex
MTEPNEAGRGEHRYERVQRLIEASIGSGDLAPGDRLPSEREMTRLYAVSRPVVREAISALELRGVLVRKQGSGMFVAPRPLQHTVANSGVEAGPFEVVEARRLLEGEVAALAAMAAGPREIRELEQILERIGDFGLDEEAREQADRAFHVALARSTTNDVLVGLVEDLWDRRYHSPLCVYFFSRAREAGIQPPMEEHRPILEAVKAHQPGAARDAMRDHLANVTKKLLAATEADEHDREKLKIGKQRFDLARRAGLSV